MKKLYQYLLSLAALGIFTTGLCCCTDDNPPTYQFPERPEKPVEPEVPSTDYPEGMSVTPVIREHDADKQTKGFLVTLDFAKNPKLRFFPTHLSPAKAPKEAFEYFKTLDRGTPYVASNGGYFWDGQSLSLCITDGEVKSIASQTAYPKNAAGEQVVAYPVRAALGQMADGRFEATWIYCVADDANRPYSFPSPLDNDEATSTYMPQPPTSKTEGARLWEPRQAIGGGPMLVFEGKNVAMANYYREVLDAGGTQGKLRAPRTAIAAKADGTKLMLFVCDGRGAGQSAGLTLEELADLFIEQGMDYAVNLDGGGSSEIIGFDGSILNHPSDGKERTVPTAVVLGLAQ